MVLIRVVFPDPFGPTNAVTFPGRIVKSTPLKTWSFPKDLCSPWMEIIDPIPLPKPISIRRPGS